MKRIVCLLVLALALPVAALASSSTDFTNSGGKLTGSSAGLTLTGSTLIAVNNLGSLGLVTGNNLGSVYFTTGALTSGSLQQGAIFAAGGAFQITGNGSDGLPNTTIFNGTFSGPLTWTMVTLANGTHNYTLSGSLTGTWYTGVTVNGATVQLTINTGKGFFNGTTTISSGDTNMVSSVPEPGTLTLLGTGLVGLAGVLRRKLKT
jgi:hypothetical protein